MNHYICTGGCGGVSESPGACQTENCPKHGQPLTECGCTDGKHEGVEALELDLELPEGEEKEEKEKSEEQTKKISEAASGMSLGGAGLFIAGAMIGGIVGAGAGLLLCQSAPGMPTNATSSPVTVSQVIITPTPTPTPPTSDPRTTSTPAEATGVSTAPAGVPGGGSAPSPATSSSNIPASGVQ